jgi:hypothetical protein
MATALEKEIGHGNSGLMPWSAFSDVTEPVPEIRRPQSITTYSARRTDVQLLQLSLCKGQRCDHFFLTISPGLDTSRGHGLKLIDLGHCAALRLPGTMMTQGVLAGSVSGPRLPTSITEEGTPK